MLQIKERPKVEKPVCLRNIHVATRKDWYYYVFVERTEGRNAMFEGFSIVTLMSRCLYFFYC